MRRVEGSLTIEAALILPLVLSLFLMTARAGIMLYMEYEETSVSILKEKEWDTVKYFYMWNKIGEFMEDED